MPPRTSRGYANRHHSRGYASGRHHHHHNHTSRHSHRVKGRPIFKTPQTTPACVVFPYDFATQTFKTTNYSTDQTGGRANLEEIEQFLKEINAPVLKWHEEYGKIYETSGIYCCLLIALLVIPPFFIFYLCWLTSKQGEAQEKLWDVQESVRQIIAEKGASFVGRDLTWNVPVGFPQWVELLTEKVEEKPVGIQSQGQGQGGGILTIQVQQKQAETAVNENNMVSYQQSGYPQPDSSQGNLISSNQHQSMFNANTYS